MPEGEAASLFLRVIPGTSLKLVRGELLSSKWDQACPPTNSINEFCYTMHFINIYRIGGRVKDNLSIVATPAFKIKNYCKDLLPRQSRLQKVIKIGVRVNKICIYLPA